MEKTLNEIEAKSAVWQKISRYAKGRIDTLRKRNDGDLGELETAKLRGKIAAFKEMLDLADDGTGPKISTNDQQ